LGNAKAHESETRADTGIKQNRHKRIRDKKGQAASISKIQGRTKDVRQRDIHAPRLIRIQNKGNKQEIMRKKKGEIRCDKMRGEETRGGSKDLQGKYDPPPA